MASLKTNVPEQSSATICRTDHTWWMTYPRNFGSLTAVSHVSCRVHKGELCGLVGSDGAGKTTLLRMIAGMIQPTSGSIHVDGFSGVHQRNEVKERIGYMPQRFGLYQDLTVAENFDFFMDIYGITGVERERRRERYLGFSNLLAISGSQGRCSFGRYETESSDWPVFWFISRKC